MISCISPRPGSPGFTLIELTMVLFVVALILGGLLAPMSTRMESAGRKDTSLELDQVRENLTGYAMINGHLPCPDCADTSGAGCAAINAGDPSAINDGEEDGVDGSTNPATRGNFAACATEEGNLPWVTLGLNEVDSWGSRFLYRVDETFADDIDGTGGSCSIAAGISFQICSTGNVNVQDESGNAVASNLPAIVVSFGRNVDDTGNPSSTFEQENQDGDAVFIEKDYSNDPANEFDDMLVWLTPAGLIYRMVQTEQLP